MISVVQLGLGLGRVLSPCYVFHKNSEYLLLKLVIPSPHDSGGIPWSSEQMDLQVDYWLVGGNKRDINKVSMESSSNDEKRSRFISPQASYMFIISSFI